MERKKIISTLVLGVLFFLVSCSVDAPDKGSKAVSSDLSTTAHFSLGLSVGSYIPEFQEGGAPRAIETQSFQYLITDGVNKFLLKEDGKPDTSTPSKRGHLDHAALVAQGSALKFYLQVRKKSDKSLVGNRYGKWEYASRGTTGWRLNGAELTITGVNPATDALQARVVIGSNLDVENSRIVVPAPIYKELDLSSENKVSIPVPYASEWVDLTYDSAKQLYATAGDASIKLRPLGVLLVTTVRSTMKQQVSLTGVRYVTNALAFQGEYNLTGDDQIPFKGIGLKHTMGITGDVFYSVTYPFSSRVTLSSKPSNRVIVSWAMSTRKSKSEVWNSQKNMTGTLDNMVLSPQTHVYAEGVQDASGRGIDKPNYAMVPIMGTTGNFEDGKSAAINCELYNQPEQLLGYFAQYTINSSGDGFDKSHDDDKVSLVNWTKAREFLHGKELTSPNGERAIYTMGNLGQAGYMLNYASAPWSLAQHGSYIRYYDQNDHSKGSVILRTYPQIYLDKENADGTVSVGHSTARYTMSAYFPHTPKVVYSLMGRDFSLDRRRSANQSILRAEATYPNGVGKFPVGRVHMKSIFVGKYFVGTLYSPFLDFIPACDEATWRDARVIPGLVERIFPAAGNYRNASWSPANPTVLGDLDSEFPNQLTRDGVGQYGLFWYTSEPYNYTGTSRMMSRIKQGLNPTYNGAQWLNDTQTILDVNGKEITPGTFAVRSDGSLGIMLFRPNNAGATLLEVNRDGKYMWQALLPLANRYQGDKASVPAHEN